jgi:MFS family permease
MAMIIGAKSVLVTCLIGVAISTGVIGIIPSYDNIGWLSTAYLLIVRIIQGAFTAGEQSVAPFFFLQNSPQDKMTRVSGYYNCSTMAGVVIASVVSRIVSTSDNPTFYWRFAFIAGSLAAFSGVWLRMIAIKDIVPEKHNISLYDVWNMIKKHRITVVRIAIISSCAYMTYSFPFVFMNNYIPMITNVKLPEAFTLNTALLVFETLMIPVAGAIAEKFERSKFMAYMSCIIMLTVIPLFKGLDGASYEYIAFVRFWLVVTGIFFVAPLYAWYYEQFKGDEKFLITGLGYTIGAELCGRTTPAICFGLWHIFGVIEAPAFYVAGLAFFTTVTLLLYKQVDK